MNFRKYIYTYEYRNKNNTLPNAEKEEIRTQYLSLQKKENKV